MRNSRRCTLVDNLVTNLAFEIHTETNALLGESPVWCAEQSCLWWIDIEGRQIHRTSDISGETLSWTTPEMPGFVVLTDSNLPAVGMESGIFLFFEGGGTFEKIVPLDVKGVRFNDATVDSTGRLWAGTIDIKTTLAIAELYTIGSDRQINPVVSDLFYTNGLAVDPDRNRLYLSDSHPDVQTIWRYSCDSTTGRLADRTIFVNMSEMKGRPDGAAIDAYGNYWIAAVGGGVLHVFSPNGDHLREFKTPCDAPTKLIFAGPNLDRLYLTSKGDAGWSGAVVVGRASSGAAICGRKQAVWRINK